MAIFYTGDQHYFYKNIIKYENRPYLSINEMNEDMIKRHNKKVAPTDDIYFLGDFAFASASQIENLLRRLNGRKFLIFGNHDKEILHNKNLQSYFVFCRHYHSLIDNGTPVILFHYPIQVWDRKHHGSIHLYGHIHTDKENHHPLVKDIENAYNVGVDVRNFEPVSLKEILN
jgi:calcineurin-like phosphoesterase family protein